MKQPIAGIAGTKPRAPKPEGNNGKPSREEPRALDREYRVQRNLALQLKNRREEMLSARARGELIETRLVRLQASFLLTAMRRQALALPQAYCETPGYRATQHINNVTHRPSVFRVMIRPRIKRDHVSRPSEITQLQA